MELTPAKFLALFLFLSVTGWLLFTFAARLAAWMLSRMIGAELTFRFGGLNCLKDISLNLKKGTLESLVIGEVRIRTSRPCLDSQGHEFGRTSMFQVLLYDAEIVLRKPAKQTTTKGPRPKRHPSGRGKWMLIATMAKYVTISVVELVVQVPDWTCEVKELDLGVDSEESGLALLGARLVLTSCSIYDREHHAYLESSLSLGQRLFSVGSRGSVADGAATPCSVEQLSINSTFSHAREHGVTIRQIDVMFGEVMLDVNEELLRKLMSFKGQKEVKVVESNPSTAEVGGRGLTTRNRGRFLANAPEKASLSLPKLLLRCNHKEKKCALENEIVGVQITCSKLQHPEASGSSLSRLDMNMDSGEIQLLRDGDKSLVEVMKAAVIASLEISEQTDALPQAEVDVKLGGAQCHLLTSKLERWVDVLSSIKPARDEGGSVPPTQKVRSSRKKRMSWTCTISAPDMVVSVHDLEGVVIYNVSLQTSHVFLNSASQQGTGIHTELGELYFYMAEEKCTYHRGLFGMDTNSGCLMQMSRVTLDLDTVIDSEGALSSEATQRQAVLAVEVTGTAVHLTLQRMQALLTSSLGLLHHFKHLMATRSKSRQKIQGTPSTTLRKRSLHKTRLSIEGLSVQYCAQMHVAEMEVPDPKKVNFGSQGGEVVMEETSDGKLRMASVKVAKFYGLEGSNLVCKFTTDMASLQVQIDHHKNDVQVSLQRVRAAYQELGSDMTPVCDILVAALQNGKVMYQMGKVESGGPGCLVCLSGLQGRWEPDLHLFFLDAFLRLKVCFQNQKQIATPLKALKQNNDKAITPFKDSEVPKPSGKSKFGAMAVAVDLEHVYVSAALADGVDASISIRSVFSEDFKVGILVEELKVALKGAALVRSKRLQVARIPCFIRRRVEDMTSRHGTEVASGWDYLIQGSGMHIILPYRLECRAIDDAVEDTWRGLKLAMYAQKMSIAGSAMADVKPKRKAGGSSSSVGAVKFLFESISAEIEEEPLQGWLDEHHQMLMKQKLELDVRERLLDEFITEEGKADSVLEGRRPHLHDLKEKLQQQAFRVYLKACKKLEPYESSGSVRSPFQLGFRPSVNRGSLFSIRASNLEVTLLDIEGGRQGMIEEIRKLDCLPPQTEIPYSRVLGKRVKILTSSLIVQLRNYTLPLLSGVNGKCNGQLIFARQATCFPRQAPQELYVGRWRKLTMLRSESGTTPPFKMFSELPIEFDKADMAFGVGFEPALADVTYAFTVALRRANLSVHDVEQDPVRGVEFYGASTRLRPQPPKKERNLPWWDDMRYYVHGRNSILSTDFKLMLLATSNPYEAQDMMKLEASSMDIQQQEGSLSFFAKDFILSISSLESLAAYQGSRLSPINQGQGSICSPFFKLDISMEWDCDTGNPLFHYLHAFPHELVTREKVFDPFRSTSLILKWNFRLADAAAMGKTAELARGHSSRPLNADRYTKDRVYLLPHENTEKFPDVPTMKLAGHDLIWIFKWWNILYTPPHKLRTFAKWPRFALARVSRSGNLSLDKVLTDFMLRVDASPAQIKHISLVSDDPAKGLMFNMKKFKYELCYSRGKKRYTFDCKRDSLELVYQGLDLHMLRADLVASKNRSTCDGADAGSTDEPPHDTTLLARPTEDGYFFTTDYFSSRKQAPKADLSRLSVWQEEARRPSSTGPVEFTHGSGSDPTRSEPSDDDGFNIVLPDNCLHVSLYGLKLLWAIYTRDAVWAWVQNISRAFEAPKPSPSRQYAQRKILEEQSKLAEQESGLTEGSSVGSSARLGFSPSPSRQDIPPFHPSPMRRSINSTSGNHQGQDETEEEGTMLFMVNVVQPQFNLQSEEARGRFLLAAASGRVMARSFRSIINVRPEMIAQTPRLGTEHLSGNLPELTWSRRELSVILEQVQAHVAPTDVDPGAGLQWLPKIPRGSQKVKRTGALLERVFMPCEMYFQYTRCKSEATDIKVKALKELSFNSTNITAIMTSSQFQVMVDIISNLLLARLPKPRKYFSLHGGDEEDDMEEETDEVVPEGVPEVELARIKLEETERELKLLSADLRTVSQGCSTLSTALELEIKESEPWMMQCEKRKLVVRLREEWSRKAKLRKVAARSLRLALQRAAQQRFKEKEKTKSVPSAMRISWSIDKIVWSMLVDGHAFAEAEISNMNLNVDRDFHEVGIAQLIAKHFVVKNCLPHAKSSTVLSAWNPPTEWTRNAMLRVDARQGAPKEGNSPLELFQVEIYPLRIHLTERMYRMMWDYFFPKEGRDTQRRQVWKASTTAVVKRGKKITSGTSELTYSSASKREQFPAKAPNPISSFLPHSKPEDWQGVDFRLTAQLLEKDAKIAGARGAKASGLLRSSSFDASKGHNLDDHPMGLVAVQKLDSNLALSLTRSTHCAQTDHGQVTQESSSVTISAENGSLKLWDSARGNKFHKLPRDDKRLVKSNSQDEKKSTGINHTNLEFQNIKISQVELLVTYEGSRLSVNERRLFMDTFTRVEFTGTWRRLFSRVKKHIIWSVLKSVAGMQGKKFKDKLPSQGHVEGGGYPGDESSSSDSDGSNVGVYEHLFPSKFKRPSDRAGERFVSSIRGLFNSQRRRAKAGVLRTKPVDSEAMEASWTEGEAENAPFTRQLSISKAKKLLRRHTKKFLSSTRHRGSILFKEQSQGSPSFQSEASSDASSCYEEIELVEP